MERFQRDYDKVVENCTWVIGNGLKTNFWLENWTGEILACKFKIPDQFHSNLKYCVADYWDNNSWALHENIHLAFPRLRPLISSFFIVDLAFEDSLVLRSMEGGRLSIKHACDMISKTSGLEKWSDFPWDHDSAPAHSMLVCKLIQNRISTNENLSIIGFSFPSLCSLC